MLTKFYKLILGKSLFVIISQKQCVNKLFGQLTPNLAHLIVNKYLVK